MEETAIADSVQEQPQEQLSVEDRLAKAMGLDDEEVQPAQQPEEEPEEQAAPEEEEPQEESPEEEFEILEINGEQYQVPKELKEGYLRQQDYTRKTQEVAAERQAVQEQRESLEAERQAFQNQVLAQQQNLQLYATITAYDQQIAQYKDINWQQLMDSDPVEAMKLDRSLRDLQESRNQAVQQAIQMQQQMDYQRQMQFVQMVEDGKKQIQQKIPDWSEQKREALFNYGKTIGFNDNELRSVVDPRYVEVLHKAFLYDQLQASKPAALKKVSQPTKTLQKASQASKQNKADVLKKIIKTSSDKSAKNNAIQQLIASKI